MLISASKLFNDWDGLYPIRSQRYYETAWKQEDNNYILRVNIPGYGKEDVTAKVTDGVLNIHVSDSRKYAYRLPKEYDLHATRVSVDKGVLTVSVPKKPEEMPDEFEITVD